jgi:hypothetical protein
LSGLREEAAIPKHTQLGSIAAQIRCKLMSRPAGFLSQVILAT